MFKDARNQIPDSPLFSAFKDVFFKKPSQGENIDALDGVRGFAILIVIASHSNGLNLAGQGGLGVWLFFNLSAFLLTIPFVANPGKIISIKNLAHYFSRRIKRVFPAYYFILLVITVFHTKNIKLFLRHLLFIQADGHFWIVPQELLFYVILPLIILVNYFLLKNHKILIIPLLICLAVCAKIFLTKEVFSLNGNGKNLEFCIIPFLTGMIASYLYGSKIIDKFMYRKSIRCILLITGVLILISFFILSRYYLYTLFHIRVYFPLCWTYSVLFSILSGLFIYIISLYPESILSRVFKFNALRLIGIVSFSMYLIHPFMIDLLRTNGLSSGNLLFIITLVITILISLVSYGLIEHPFLIKRPSSKVIE